MKKTLLIGCLIFSTGSYAGLDSWISSILPKSVRASDEYRREIDHMKKQTGNTVPVICIKSKHLDGVLATAESIGFSFFHCAIIRLDEDKMQDLTQQGLTAANTRSLAHELIHAAENHGGEQRAWFRLAQLSMSIAAVGFSKIAIDKYNNSPTDQRVNALTTVAFIGGCYAVEKTVEQGLAYLRNGSQLRREAEYQAENGAYETMQKLGYCKALEHISTRYKSLQDQLPDDEKQDFRVKGRDYPTLGQYISIMEKAMNECRHDIDPRTTQDTPNLMRNGSPLNQPNT